MLRLHTEGLYSSYFQVYLNEETSFITDHHIFCIELALDIGHHLSCRPLLLVSKQDRLLKTSLPVREGLYQLPPGNYGQSDAALKFINGYKITGSVDDNTRLELKNKRENATRKYRKFSLLFLSLAQFQKINGMV